MSGNAEITELVLNDATFADQLVRDPVATLRAKGVEPTPEVVAALKSIDGAGLKKLVTAFGKQQAAL